MPPLAAAINYCWEIASDADIGDGQQPPMDRRRSGRLLRRAPHLGPAGPTPSPHPLGGARRRARLRGRRLACRQARFLSAGAGALALPAGIGDQTALT
jgi:hypothetical protein